MATPTPTTPSSLGARGAGPIVITLTTPYDYPPACTDIFDLTEVTYTDGPKTVIVSDISDTRFGACQPTGYAQVDITSRFTYSPAVCPNGWGAYSLCAANGGVSSAWCCDR